MATQRLNRRETFLLRHAPVLLIVSLVWLLLTLWRGPIMRWYVLSWIGIGGVYGACVLLECWKRPSALWNVFSGFILIGGGFFITKVLFPDKPPSDWFHESQGISIVFVCFFALGWAFRRKIMSSY